MNAFVIYCSPAGSTKHVAEVIGKTLADLGQAPVMIDLCDTKNAVAVKTRIKEIRQDSVLFIGSPVYAFHAVPPVMEFIERLPGNAQRLQRSVCDLGRGDERYCPARNGNDAL